MQADSPSPAAGEPITRRRFVRRLATGAVALGAAGGVVRGNSLVASRSRSPAAPTRPIRVALATDMHAPHEWVDLEELARAVRDFDPDFLFVAGDAFNRRGDEHLVAAYARLPARFGKFASLGNWEYQSRCDRGRLRREYERAGVRLLVNEAAGVDVRGEMVRVAGLDDLLHGHPAPGAIERATRGTRQLVLAHCPALFHDVVRVAPPGTSQTVFSGHTHGGQIAPFGHALVTPPGSSRFVKGWYTEAGTPHQLYVSRGLGNSDIPIRIGSPPEVALLEV